MSRVIFDEAAHRYTLDGAELPSVTTVCRFLSVDVAAKASPWLRDLAADRGSRVHAYTVMLDYGEEPEDVDSDCIGYLDAYRRFLKDYSPEWGGIEHIMGNANMGFAGTCDRYGTIGGVPCILDIKTSSQLNHPATAAQLQGYSYLLMAENRRKPAAENPQALYALQLRKDGTYRLFNLTKMPRDLFLYCLQLHNSMKCKGEEL